MANGGGRGWFRRKPRPEPAPPPAPEPTRIEAYDAQRTASDDDPTRRREFDELMDPERRLAASGSSAPRPEDDRAWAPRMSEDTATQQGGDEAEVPRERDRSAVRALHQGVADVASVGPKADGADQAVVRPRPARYDWDAATAAALSDEAVATSVPAGVNPSKVEPDRLLEEIIREIVGDATAETVSSLHPSREAVPEAEQTSTADAPGGDAGTPPPVHESPLESLSQSDRAEQTAPPPGESDSATPLSGDDAVGSAGAAMVEYPSQGAHPAAGSIAGPPDEVEREDEPVVVAAAMPDTSPHREETTGSSGDVSRETPESDGGTPLADQIADETRRRLALDEAVLPLPPATRVLTISNQKGGVGKTTSAVNLAAALARAGARVLVIDLDPQGNASTALGVDHRSERQSVYEVLVSDLPLAEVIQQSTEHERLDCVPATIHLAGAEIELVSLVAREQRLRRALDAHLATMERPYDYVFIDCPPSLGLLTINAFVAAREVLIPIQCEYYALEGLSQLLSNIELIEKHLNPELRLSTILLTMYDSRTNLAQQVAQEVRDHFPAQTLDTIIPRSVRVSEAPSYGQSVISYDFASSGSLSYREAAAEIARRGASQTKETN